VAANNALELGRDAFARRAWREAYERLSAADETAPLGREDLELAATAAYMLGQDDDYVRALERAHHLHLQADDPLAAARCAGWVGMTLMLRGEIARGSGWLGRAQRLVERHEDDCAERGWLLFSSIFEYEAAGDLEAAAETAAAAAEIGERFGDRDLFGLSVANQGALLVRLGRVREGLARLDEAMVAVVAGEMSPIVSGLVYCGVIVGCREAHEPRRAHEWTAALTRWCEQQPDMVAFTGRCLVHRAEIMQLHGSWAEALAEAEQAAGRQGMTPGGVAEAFYRQGELHRLRGELAAAEDAYRSASRSGLEPQPGLALLRLAQGRTPAAAAAISRAVAETSEPFLRVGLLPAYVEIMLAVGESEEARAASRELEELTAGQPGVSAALAAEARASVELAEGDARAALVSARNAWRVWQELEAPYEAARARVFVGLACRELGDDDAATLELDAARAAFEQLGATPDLRRLDSLARRATADTHGLTARELQVLRLVAAGRSNREIAADLMISEHTVARHVQNTFAKLHVSSRTAAAAYAFEHHLV
jgi:DNA-binding CsgD family transcriptional regulator